MKTREIKKMGTSRRKGSVVPLGSQFPLEEIHKASKRVQDAITDKNNELHRLQTFLSDNNNLVNLVQKLPEQLSHDVMVPFGKAAFFPGRLIHTNEFLVLLGEGYYADRTSKQTVEILQRRGKTLDSQVDSIQAMIKDLEAEASLFNATASEVEDGIVEIMEEYVENGSDDGESESESPMEDAPSCGNDTATKVEYASLLSKMDELEKQEELDAQNGDSSEETTVDFDHSPYQRPVDNNPQNPEDINQATPLDRVANNNYFANDLRKKHNHQEDIADQLNFASLAVQSQVREGKNLSQNVKSVDASLKHPISQHPISQAASASKIEAFTGSIVEHAENLQTSSREQSSTSQVSGSQSLKPVSRFKMQRR